MTNRTWRFSLGSLFTIVTVVSLVLALSVTEPRVAIFALLVTSPFITVVVMATLKNHSSVLYYLAIAALCLVLAMFSVYLFLLVFVGNA